MVRNSEINYRGSNQVWLPKHKTFTDDSKEKIIIGGILFKKICWSYSKKGYADPPLGSGHLYIKDAQCAETNEK